MLNLGRSAIVALFTTFLCCGSALSEAGKGSKILDAPLKPSTPTVGSEIYRGFSAPNACTPLVLLAGRMQRDPDERDHDERKAYRECIETLHNNAIQNYSSNAPFDVGLFFRAWHDAVTKLEVRSRLIAEAREKKERQ